LIYVRNSETELASDIVVRYRCVDLNYKKLAVENVKLVRAKRAYISSHGMACSIMIADFCHSKLIHTILILVLSRLLVFWKCLVRLSARAPTNLRFAVIFLIPFGQVLGWLPPIGTQLFPSTVFPLYPTYMQYYTAWSTDGIVK